jgi:hypothetical protein
MIESTTKMSRAVGQSAAGRDGAVHEDDATLGDLTCLSARKKTIALRSDTSATLCFIRGTGKMTVRDASVDYHDGEWFEITGLTAYQIFPDTVTVLLTIQKPGTASA